MGQEAAAEVGEVCGLRVMRKNQQCIGCGCERRARGTREAGDLSTQEDEAAITELRHKLGTVGSWMQPH